MKPNSKSLQTTVCISHQIRSDVFLFTCFHVNNLLINQPERKR